MTPAHRQPTLGRGGQGAARSSGRWRPPERGGWRQQGSSRRSGAVASTRARQPSLGPVERISGAVETPGRGSPSSGAVERTSSEHQRCSSRASGRWRATRAPSRPRAHLPYCAHGLARFATRQGKQKSWNGATGGASRVSRTRALGCLGPAFRRGAPAGHIHGAAQRGVGAHESRAAKQDTEVNGVAPARTGLSARG